MQLVILWSAFVKIVFILNIFSFIFLIDHRAFCWLHSMNLPPGRRPRKPNAVITGLSGSSGLGRTEMKWKPILNPSISILFLPLSFKRYLYFPNKDGAFICYFFGIGKFVFRWFYSVKVVKRRKVRFDNYSLNVM